MERESLRRIFEIIDRDFEQLGLARYSNKDDNTDTIESLQRIAKGAICAYIDASAEKAKMLTIDERLRGLRL